MSRSPISPTVPAKPFFMIRHGQSEANVEEVQAGGEWDTPLTEYGRQQARDNHPILQALETKPVSIVHSQLSRAKDTASLLNEVLKLPMTEDPDVAEQYCGGWARKPWKDVRTLIQQGISPPDGETHEEFSVRVHRGITNALNTQESPTMIVCHGGVFRGFCAPYGIRLPRIENCVLYEFEPLNQPQGNNGFPWVIWEHTANGKSVLEPETKSYYSESA